MCLLVSLNLEYFFNPLIFQDANIGETLVSLSLWCSSILHCFDFFPSHDLGWKKMYVDN